jgi:hypothetical protein
MGSGLLGWAANLCCISWTLFVCVIFSFPTLRPVTALNMNYASVRLRPDSVDPIHNLKHRLSRSGSCSSLCAFHKFSFPTTFTETERRVWYFLHAHKHYKGPTSNIRQGVSSEGTYEKGQDGEKEKLPAYQV